MASLSISNNIFLDSSAQFSFSSCCQTLATVFFRFLAGKTCFPCCCCPSPCLCAYKYFSPDFRFGSLKDLREGDFCSAFLLKSLKELKVSEASASKSHQSKLRFTALHAVTSSLKFDLDLCSTVQCNKSSNILYIWWMLRCDAGQSSCY